MATETAIAIEMVTVTAMTPTLTPSALPLNAQQVVQKIPHHKSGRCSYLTGQNGGSINQGMNRLPYNLANQRSHIGRMATITTILIRVISLLGKWNELMHEVFWWLMAGREHLMIFFPPKSPRCALGGGALCMRYISYVGIKTGLNSFQNFPYVITFSLRSISVFYLWKTEWFRKELSPSETVTFGQHDFGKRSFSEILDQCNFGKNGVWRKILDSLLFHLLSKNTWTSAILERIESCKKIGNLTIAFT